VIVNERWKMAHDADTHRLVIYPYRAAVALHEHQCGRLSVIHRAGVLARNDASA
jgi:hypothetical protein